MYLVGRVISDGCGVEPRNGDDAVDNARGRVVACAEVLRSQSKVGNTRRVGGSNGAVRLCNVLAAPHTEPERVHVIVELTRACLVAGLVHIGEGDGVVVLPARRHLVVRADGIVRGVAAARAGRGGDASRDRGRGGD